MDEATARRQTQKLHSVFTQMVDLLIAYEIEAIAYQKTLQMADNEFRKVAQQGKDSGLQTAVAGLISSPTTRIAAELRFVKISQLRKSITEQNLDLALSGIKDVIARKTGQPPPG
jgi:hypothetical protein